MTYFQKCDNKKGLSIGQALLVVFTREAGCFGAYSFSKSSSRAGIRAPPLRMF
jgi:hypothetical protein